MPQRHGKYALTPFRWSAASSIRRTRVAAAGRRWKGHAIVLLAGLFLLPTLAAAKVNVFACEPEWASLTTALGGDLVEAFSATSAQEDAHHVTARPSLIAAMRKADLVVCTGAGLEVGWLPVLLQKSGKPQVQSGGRGNVAAADVVPLLEVPDKVDRSMGDIHPEGNPHLHLDPANIARVAQVLAARLAVIDPVHAADYSARGKDFLDRWNAASVKWKQEAASLRGMAVVVNHKSFTYLLHWLGMTEAASLEPKPGIPPTTSHLAGLLSVVREGKVRAILRTPYDPEPPAAWLSEKSGVPVKVLPFTVGGNADSQDLFSLYQSTLTLLAGVPAR